MDGAPRARTVSEEEELQTVALGLSQAQSALAALQQRGQTASAPFERLEAQCGELKERQRCVCVCVCVWYGCMSLCLLIWWSVLRLSVPRMY